MFKLKYLILLFIPQALYGLTTLHVSLATDNNPGGLGDTGDLRFCLNTMNQDLNTIPDDYAIVFDFPMTIQLNGILPIINNSANPVNITIGNPGSIITVTIDGNGGAYSGFFIPMGNVTIQNMNFQNLTAQGGKGGDGISGGGGGLGAGGAIYAPQAFLNGSNPNITLINVTITNCSAIGGDGGNYLGSSTTGDEGGGGGGGFSGDGGSISTTGRTGGAGGGGFGGDGGNATVSADDPLGGGGGGGGGLGSRATLGIITNLGNGGSDQALGEDGNGYGLTNIAGAGGGGNSGGGSGGGGGGGGGTPAGGGGGGSDGGSDGQQPQGSLAPGGAATPSGGNGNDGGGGGGGGVVLNGATNSIDGQAGSGGYGGGGGGGAGTGASDTNYTVKGGSGGTGGGGGGGGVDPFGDKFADGGNSLGGGGGGGGGPSNGSSAPGGTDQGNLGGGDGGIGSDAVGTGFGGGGGGGGSGLGGAIFVDSELNFTIKALSGLPTVFNTTGNSTTAGTGGTGGDGGGTNGANGAALGDSVFLRSNAYLTLLAQDADDILTLGEEVSFTDDTTFGGTGTAIFVRGNGTVIYNGTSNYPGIIQINNANFKVNGEINTASINVCRNIGFSSQRGTLSGTGTLTGSVFTNSGTIYPDTDGTLTLGNLTLSSANPGGGALGSLVHITINGSGASLVAITGAASLAGTLEIEIDPSAVPGSYLILTTSGITGTFDAVTFTGATPNYNLSYLPVGSPTYVQFDFLGYLESATNLQGTQKQNNFGFEYELYNQLTWQLSSSPGVVGYFIYRDGTKIATVNAATYTYQDHNQPRGVSSVYSLVAFDVNGNTSSPITVTVP